MIRLVFPLNITLDSPRPIFKAFIMMFLLSACWIRGLIFLFSVRGELLFRELTKDMEGVSEFKASSIGGFGRMMRRRFCGIWKILSCRIKIAA